MSPDFTDKQLTDNLKLDKNTEESLQELVNRHSGIFLDIVTSYIPANSTSGCREDLINDLEFYVYNAGLKFDHTKKTKFSTFLGNEAKWACLNASTKNKKYVEINDNTFDFEKVKCTSQIQNINFQEEILKSFKEEVDKHPDPRIKKIFSMRYSGQRKLTPWRKISRELNLSIQGCINIHNSALKFLSKNIKSKYEIIG